MKKIVKKNILISTDKRKLQIKVIHSFLTESYWQKGIPIELVRKVIKHSFCVGVYHFGKQIGFARVVTDFVLNAYLADVFILEEHRGKGLSKLLLEFIFKHPELNNIKTWRLGTRDAHSLYSKFGFHPPENPERMMEMKTKIW